MKITEKIMGMESTIEVLDGVKSADFDEILEYLHSVDNTFSPYNKTSEIFRINSKKIPVVDTTPEVKKVLRLCNETLTETNGFFNIKFENHIDPSGLVTGYAISEAGKMLGKKGYKNFYIEIGADMQTMGLKNGQKWKVGLPRFGGKNTNYVIFLSENGISTSGVTNHGLPIYNPIKKKIVTFFRSATVIGKNVYDSDRLSTAAFSMGERGINFIEQHIGCEGYFITRDGNEYFTSGFKRQYLIP